MFYCINPNYRYRFFSPEGIERVPEDPGSATTDEPKHNLVNALAALYKAYGGKEELKNNAVDIIYKIADVINKKNNPHVEPPEETAADPGR